MSAYLIVDIAEVHDAEAYAGYRSRVSPEIEAAGGRYLVRGGPIDVLEGTWAPRRIVVVQFDSMAAARRWWASPEYADLLAIRRRATTTNMILIDGVAGRED